MSGADAGGEPRTGNEKSHPLGAFFGQLSFETAHDFETNKQNLLLPPLDITYLWAT